MVRSGIPAIQWLIFSDIMVDIGHSVPNYKDR